jgi:translocation and assembly module TamB
LTQVTGKVHIPQAELEPTEFNSAVSPSRDVVVVSDTAEAQSGAVTKIDVTVSLGDKVKLKAMGFQGRLTGDLRVFGKTSDILLANGEIKIKEGSYLAYGQLLHVDDGSIRFAGGAIDNPELDIKAVRKGKDYQAGLHIHGFASAPQANLFSNPDMGQDDVLSYILLGKPLAQASATDAAILASAATGMGLQNGAMLGDQIASTFGLDEFSIGGDSAENAALQVGKYLSPKLYLSYGIGVFESVSTVELRYELSKIWALKAESGTESGVDLLYTYERGKPEDRQ